MLRDLREHQQKMFITLSRFWPLTGGGWEEEGEGGLMIGSLRNIFGDENPFMTILSEIKLKFYN